MLCISYTILFLALASKSQFLTSSSAPLCNIGVGFELSWSSSQIFDGTVKFVAPILMRMVWEWFPMYFGVVHDWNCLIGSLVVQCGQLT